MPSTHAALTALLAVAVCAANAAASATGAHSSALAGSPAAGSLAVTSPGEASSSAVPDPLVRDDDQDPSNYHPGLFVFFLLISSGAVVLNVLMIASVLRSSVIRTAEYTLNLNIASSDLLFGSFVLVTTVASLAQGRPWADSWFGCQAIASSLQASATSMVITVIILAFHHYSVVIYDKPSLTYTHVTFAIIATWAFSLFSAFSLYAYGGSYVVQPAHIHCHYNYLSRESSQRFITIYTLCLQMAFPILIGLVYRRIYGKIVIIEQRLRQHLEPSMIVPSNLDEFELHEAQVGRLEHAPAPPRLLVPAPAATRQQPVTRVHTAGLPPKLDSPRSPHPMEIPGSPQAGPTSSKHTIDATTSNHSGQGSAPSSSVNRSGSAPAQNTLREAMRNVANRGFFIGLVFVFAWFPSSISVIVQLATDRPISWQADAIVIFFAAMSAVVNPLMFFWVDLRLRRSLMEMLFLSR
ncbi:hypothetical protein HK105_201584 [Polyrhizophydium stewartii]|uniref:G-protein coupled receptors family 1 profile domain-containing protein n=1 Tax=Polyrhizophydium stewartii TaxID=2732419 RepID=A0ABR4NH13_9FUNG